MPHDAKMSRWAWIAIGLLGLVVAANILPSVLAQEYGKIVPLGVVVIAISTLCIGRERLLLYLARKAKQRCLSFPFLYLPGYKLLSGELQQAQAGPSGHTTVLLTLAIFMVALTGTGQLAVEQLLVFHKWLPSDWALITSFASLRGWTVVLFASLVAYGVGCILINLAVQLAFAAGHYTDISMAVRGLLHYFGLPQPGDSNLDKLDQGEYWRQWHDKLRNIYGHKAWSGHKTYEMLKELQDRHKEIGTAQWFLLEFAADALESHIFGDSNRVIKREYDGDREYSCFLERTMAYSRKSIIWIVDSNDFETELLTSAVREALFSAAQHVTEGSREAIALTDLGNLASDIGDERKDTQATGKSARICQVCRKRMLPGSLSCHSPATECPLLLKDEKATDDLLKDFETWAQKTVKAKSMQVSSWVREWLLTTDPDRPRVELNTVIERGTDQVGLPHLDAYRRHWVPKARIVDLPEVIDPENAYSPGMLGRATWQEILKLLWAQYTEKKAADAPCSDWALLKETAKKAVPGLKDEELAVYLFIFALRILEVGCKGPKGDNSVFGFANVRATMREGKIQIPGWDPKTDPEPHMDLGLYDGVVLVHSIPRQPKGRTVHWTVLRDGKLQEELSRFNPHVREPNDEGSGAVEAKCIQDHWVFPLSTLLRELETLCRAQIGE